MAGTAVISTIKHDVSGAAPTFRDGAGNEIGQLCKSWCSYNGSGTTVRGSFNTSSVTKAATGDYTMNFTNALVDGNWSGGGLNDFTSAFIITTNSTSASPLSTSARINSRTSAAGAADTLYVMLTINR